MPSETPTIAITALAILISAPISDALAQVVPASQWILNCISTTDTPQAREPYLMMKQTPPTHAENRAWCVNQWNTMHPDQKVER